MPVALTEAGATSAPRQCTHATTLAPVPLSGYQGSIIDAAIAGVTGSDSTRTVTVSTGSGNGTLHLDVSADAIIKDFKGNLIEDLPFIEGQTYTINKLVDVHVYIDGDHQDHYLMPAGASVRDNYTGINAGPVNVTSANHMPIMTAKWVIYKVNGVDTSFTEMIALPDNQLDKIYWLPWYSNRDLDTQLRFATP